MKVISTSYTLNQARKNLPVVSGRFQTFDKDTYITPITAQNPSFGHNPMQVAQEILENQSMREKFITFIQDMFAASKKVGGSNVQEYAEYAVMTALAVFGVASAGKSETTGINNESTLDKGNSMPFQDLFKLILDKADDEQKEPESESTKSPERVEGTKIDEQEAIPKTTADTVPAENIGTQSGIEIEQVQHSDAVIVQEKVEVSDSVEGMGIPTEQEQAQQEDTPVKFPRECGSLSFAQQSLKSLVEGIILPKDESEKLTYLCNIAVTKEFKTPGGDTIEGEAFAQKLYECLQKTDDIIRLVNNVYAKVTRVEQESDNPKEEVPTGTGTGVESTADGVEVKDGNNLTSLGELRQNPPRLTILGKLDTKTPGSSGIQKDGSTDGAGAAESAEPTPSAPVQKHVRKRIQHPVINGEGTITAADENSGVIHVEAVSTPGTVSTNSDGTSVNSARPKNTATDPRIRFRFSIPPVARNNNIFEPPTADREGYLDWTDAGGLAMLLANFKSYTLRDADNLANLEKYVRNLYINYLKHAEKSFKDYINTLAVRPRWATNNGMTIKEIAETREITFEDLDEELKGKYYKQIENMLFKECHGGTTRENTNVIQDILTMLNDEENQKYFQYFTIHSALRFIERYVITSKDPQTQCKKALPILFNMLKEQLSDSGVEVVSYFGTRAVSHKDKEGEEYLTITCNPNIVIYPKTDIERKFFGSHGIIIGLAEYKSPEGYNYFRMEPIIKTIESESPHNIFDSLR